MEELTLIAKLLHSQLDSDWAYENEKAYDWFANEIEKQYAEGKISAEEFDELALTAFYDYDGLKCEYAI